MKANFFRIAMAAITLAIAPAVLAQGAFPTKPVKFTSPYPSGSGPDVVTRLIADKLARYWNQTVTVEARPGANGFIAIEAVKRATPDAHELTVVDNGHVAIFPHLFKKIPYDVEKDLAPVALVYRTDFLVAVAAGGTIKTVGELIAAAKANPGKVSYGTPFVGSPSHLGSALLELMTGTQMLHVPFKETSQMVASVASGDVTWTLSTIATTGPMVRAGKVKLIGLAAKNRLASHPDIPTVLESGGPADYEVNGWVAFLTARGAPAESINAINRDVGRALGEPDVRERFAAFGFLPIPTSPQALTELIRSDSKKFGDLVRRTGASSD